MNQNKPSRSKFLPASTIVSFYNVENLFDTIDDPLKNDGDFLPDSPKKWTNYRYSEKLENIAESISSIHP